EASIARRDRPKEWVDGSKGRRDAARQNEQRLLLAKVFYLRCLTECAAVGHAMRFAQSRSYGSQRTLLRGANDRNSLPSLPRRPARPANFDSASRSSRVASGMPSPALSHLSPFHDLLGE